MTDSVAGRGQSEAMEDGLRTVECGESVERAVERLRSELEHRKVNVFALIDHAKAAREVGLEMPDEVVVIFGNPAVGTRLMHENARAGIDLPLRILIWDNDGTTTVAYTPPAILGDRFALTDVLTIRFLTDFMYNLTTVICK